MEGWGTLSPDKRPACSVDISTVVGALTGPLSRCRRHWTPLNGGDHRRVSLGDNRALQASRDGLPDCLPPQTQRMMGDHGGGHWL